MLAPTERAEAGNVLAQLGDPRFRADAFGLPDEPLLGFVEVPAGPFVMGTRKEDIAGLVERYGGERSWYERETPQRRPTLPVFYLARYPVTQAQYACFAHETRHPASEAELDFERPYAWSADGHPPHLANHPVVGVSWHDALAYCEWLTDKLRASPCTPEPLAHLLRHEGWRISLPSEAQWEKAACGDDGRAYPWGADPDPDRANYADSEIGGTSSVGCFPDGASPYGVLDMSGNVDEWCLTKWRDNYKSKPDDSPEGDDRRVLRGGSYDFVACYVRCASRGRFYPLNRSFDLGFRVVASPIIQGSGL